MDKIARIRQEIERRKSLLTQHSKLTYDLILDIFIKEYDDLISFLDTLSEEPDKSLDADLEKEIDNEWKKCNPIDEGMGVETANIHIEAFDMIAHHFYELGKKDMKNQMMKESVEANVIATKCGDKYQQLLITDWNGFNDLFNSDKVHIIVLKAEEESK